MKQINFVTNNKTKIISAELVLRQYDISVVATPLDVDEIQHHDPAQISHAKAEAAYARLQTPLVIHDSSWSIPALGGFPGGYMKDVAAWLTAEDF